MSRYISFSDCGDTIGILDCNKEDWLYNLNTMLKEEYCCEGIKIEAKALADLFEEVEKTKQEPVNFAFNFKSDDGELEIILYGETVYVY